ETEASVQSIGRFLIVIEHEVPTHGRDGRGETNSQTPARNVGFVDGLVADFTVAGVPDPMPIVVEAIVREGLERSGTRPEVIMNARRNGFLGSAPDRWAPFVAKRAGHVHVADRAVMKMLNGFHHSRV